MVEIRRIRPEEVSAAVRLADEVFRADGGKSMGETYPAVFFPGYHQSLGVFEDGRLVSFIGLVPNVVYIGPAELQTYSVGAVCTAEAFRGRGYAGNILEQVIRHLDDVGSPLLLAVEWAGSEEAVVALLADSAQRANVSKLKLRIGWHEDRLLHRLSSIPSVKARNEGTALITDPTLFLEQVRPYLERKNKPLSDRLDAERSADGSVKVTFGKETAAMELDDFISLAFEGECPEFVAGSTREELRSLFPIPFPYTAGINFV